MYRYQHDLVSKEALYIAGPECFYTYGYDALAAMRARAEALGFCVTLPNDDPLDLDNANLQKRADSIFANLEEVMLKTTAIVADLEAYRGAEPDSGTIFEIGMAYAKGAKCYGYTRDKRSFGSKNLNAHLCNGKVTDEFENCEMYQKLPFSPTIIGSTKIIEGDFDDCLKMIICDKEEEIKLQTKENLQERRAGKSIGIDVRKNKAPIVYLSGVERYQKNAKEIFEHKKQICRKYGLTAVTPTDLAEGVKEIITDQPYVWAANMFEHYQNHVRVCDAIIADLNNYRGYEVNNDVGFECGMAFQLGKKMYGYMNHADPLVNRIPHLGEPYEFRDHTGSNVENFDYPVNLMFGCSMDILEGTFEEIIKKVASDLLEK